MLMYLNQNSNEQFLFNFILDSKKFGLQRFENYNINVLLFVNIARVW